MRLGGRDALFVSRGSYETPVSLRPSSERNEMLVVIIGPRVSRATETVGISSICSFPGRTVIRTAYITIITYQLLVKVFGVQSHKCLFFFYSKSALSLVLGQTVLDGKPDGHVIIISALTLLVGQQKHHAVI